MLTPVSAKPRKASNVQEVLSQRAATQAMKRSAQTSIAAAALAWGLSLLGPAAYAATPLLNGFGGPSGYGENFLDRNDDGSTTQLPLPFAVNFYGTTYNSLWVNNNGNVTFSGPLGAFTPSAFPGAPQPMIAPWWADVDTRNGASDTVYYDAPNENSFVVTWPNVGYFSNRADKLNSFQLVLQRNPGDTSGAFTAQFRYAQLEWTTGSASGGSDGLGGTPAVAGYDAGNNMNYYMLPGSRTGAVLDVVNLSNVSNDTPGLWQFSFTAGGEAPGETPQNPLMPVVVDNNFVFQFPVQPNRPFFIDPPVAVGYNYTVTGGPLFTSVIAPDLSDPFYDLYFSTDNCNTYTQYVDRIVPNVEFDFASSQSCFSIQEIDVALNLDPTNTLAFVTGVSFDTPGFVNVIQTPIIVNTDPTSSVPGPLPFLGALAAFRWSRRLRSKILAIQPG